MSDTTRNDDVSPTRMARGLFGMVLGLAAFGLVSDAFGMAQGGPSMLAPAASAPSLGGMGLGL